MSTFSECIFLGFYIAFSFKHLIISCINFIYINKVKFSFLSTIQIVPMLKGVLGFGVQQLHLFAKIHHSLGEFSQFLSLSKAFTCMELWDDLIVSWSCLTFLTSINSFFIDIFRTVGNQTMTANPNCFNYLFTQSVNFLFQNIFQGSIGPQSKWQTSGNYKSFSWFNLLTIFIKSRERFHSGLICFYLGFFQWVF